MPWSSLLTVLHSSAFSGWLFAILSLRDLMLSVAHAPRPWAYQLGWPWSCPWWTCWWRTGCRWWSSSWQHQSASRSCSSCGSRRVGQRWAGIGRKPACGPILLSGCYYRRTFGSSCTGSHYSSRGFYPSMRDFSSIWTGSCYLATSWRWVRTVFCPHSATLAHCSSASQWRVGHYSTTLRSSLEPWLARLTSLSHWFCSSSHQVKWQHHTLRLSPPQQSGS